MRIRGGTTGCTSMLAVALVVGGCEKGPASLEQEPTTVLIEPTDLELEGGSTGALNVTVLDQSGNPMSSLPAGLAIGWSSSDVSVVTVSAAGAVTGHLPGEARVTAAVMRLGSGGGLSSGVGAYVTSGGSKASGGANVTVRPTATDLQAVGDTLRSGVVGEPLGDSLVVAVLDKRGRGMKFAPVHFVVGEGGGSVSDTLVVTGDDGLARTEWRLGPLVGEQRVMASADGLESVTFRATASDAPQSAVMSGGDGQRGTVGGQLPQPIAVKVLDTFNRGIAGVRVKWAAVQAGASVGATSGVTDANGLASTTWTLGATAGAQSATAQVGTLSPLVFQATAKAGSPSKLVKIGGEGQTGTVGQTLTQDLAVKITDFYDNPVSGVAVGWAPGAADNGRLSPRSPTTDAAGLAKATWTLGSVSGSQVAQATASGLTAVAFSATALPSGETAPSVATVSVTPATAPMLVGDSIQLTAVARDASGTVLSGVTFSWSTSAASIAAVSSSGKVHAVAPGSAVITAAADGKSGSAAITVTASSGTGENVTRVVATPPGPITLGTIGDTVQLSATALDASGATVPGIGFTWTTNKSTVATVDGAGRVVSKGIGTALIAVSAACSSCTAADTVAIVVNQVVASVVVTPTSGSIQVGQSLQLSADALDAKGHKMSATVSWSSSNTAVATVSSTGNVTGRAGGSAAITASASGKSATASIGVADSPSEPPPAGDPQSPAELPRVYLNTAYVTPAGSTIRVPAGGDLQAALNNARPGDRILLQAGATYTGAFVFPPKSGSGWITVETETTLPPEGTRMNTSYPLARLIQPGYDAAARFPSGSHHYRLVGLELTAAGSVTGTNSIVRMEPGASSITLDRVYVHGHSTLNFQRCVMANADSVAVIDSYISECHGKGMDSQAIAAWDSHGPLKIVNNFLEGAGENILFGGADPSTVGTVPSDIEFRRNYVYKPTSWKGVWSVKNLFESKNAQRLLMEGNVFENNWTDAQVGFGILLKSFNDSNCTWCVTQDVTFQNNIVKNSEKGMNIADNGGTNVTQNARRIFVYNNSFEGTPTILFQLLGAISQVTIDHNTGIPGNLAVSFDGSPDSGLVMTNNLMGRGNYGVKGSGTGEGTATLSSYAPGYVFTGNAIVGATSSVYPAGNYFPSTTGGAPSGVGANTTTLQSKVSGVAN